MLPCSFFFLPRCQCVRLGGGCLCAQLAAKLAMESAKMNLEMETPPSIDWAAWEGKISDPAVLAKVKAITEAEVEKGMADFQGPNTDELQKEVEHEFNKAGGLVRPAASARARVPPEGPGRGERG